MIINLTNNIEIQDETAAYGTLLAYIFYFLVMTEPIEDKFYLDAWFKQAMTTTYMLRLGPSPFLII